MKIEKRMLISSALFVGGYVSFTLLDEVYFKKNALNAELIQPLLVLVAAVVVGLGVWEAYLRFADRGK